MTATQPSIDVGDLVDPTGYTAGPPHETLARLRRESPVHWCDLEGVPPFWAITRHADITHVSTHPELFTSTGRLALGGVAGHDPGPRLGKTLLNTDPPEHRDYRNLAGPYFRPRILRGLEDGVREITRTLLDRIAAAGPDAEFDFVTDFASRHPLKMICHILGVAERDEPVVLRIANLTFGGTDPEFAADVGSLVKDAFGFLGDFVAEKRANPVEDLGSVLANGELHGERIADWDLLSYLGILVTAGHETTRNSIAGGVLALIEHPDQLQLLRQRPELCAHAADEMVRWVTPVQHFIRTATRDTEVGGQPIGEGEALCLFYASGNRDEDVFGDPFTFRVDRDPNRHLGWGVGEHYCLGASLANLEIRVVLEELIPRLEHIELAGEPQLLASTFSAGPKHLPVRWRLASAC